MDDCKDVMSTGERDRMEIRLKLIQESVRAHVDKQFTIDQMTKK